MLQFLFFIFSNYTCGILLGATQTLNKSKLVKKTIVTKELIHKGLKFSFL